MMDENYGPYGKEQVKILDASFQNILENIANGTCKVMMYCADKELPSTLEDYDKYNVLKKYEKHERYPDPLVRLFIEIHSNLGYTKEQLKNMNLNVIQKLKEIKESLKVGISMLFEAKEHICKSLMMLDIFKKNLMRNAVTRDQLIWTLEKWKNIDMKVSNEAVFGLEKDIITYNQRLDIPDPKLLATVQSQVKGSDEPPTSFLTNAFSSTYVMTLLKCN